MTPTKSDPLYTRMVHAFGDVPAGRLKMIKHLLIQMTQELEFQLDASKGGNVRGVTEDHRYEMVESLHVLRATIAGLPSERRVKA